MANRALEGAKRKGRVAYGEGLELKDCPYGDHRTDRGSVTFSRAFIRAWVDGWEAAQGEKEKVDG